MFIEQLNSPFAMAIVGGDIYVANTDALIRYPYVDKAMEINDRGVKVAVLPAGEINYQRTKNIISNHDGTRVYVTVGSNSNAEKNGLENEVNRVSIFDIVLSTGASQIFVSGLRNPNGLGFNYRGLFPTPFQNGAFIGQHGSWNREILSGYKVIFVPFTDGEPDGDAYGRLAGVALGTGSALLVDNDVGNRIWRMTAQSEF